jgi:hypothetical protein
MENMCIKRTLRYYFLGESLKEIEVNRIFGKVSKKDELSNREKRFIELYNHKIQDDKDFMYLSKNTTCERVKDLLERGKKVICDLHDRDGLIGLPVMSIENDYEEEFGLVIMKNETHKLSDKFLYNIIYNQKLGKYSLQEQDEYFEKITINNNDN